MRRRFLFIERRPLLDLLTRGRLAEALQLFRQVAQLAVHAPIDRVGRISAVRSRLAGRHPGEDLNPFVDAAHRIDVKLAAGHRLDHVLPQHQVGHVGRGYNHALLAGEAGRGSPEGLEIPFDLGGGRADGLHFPALVDRPRYRDALLDRQAGQAGQERIEFRRRGAIAVYPIV